MKYSVDRIEEDIVILQDIERKEILEVKKDELPEDIKDGDIVILEDDIFTIDKEETNKKMNEVINRFQALKK